MNSRTRNSPRVGWFQDRWPVWAAWILSFWSGLVRTRVIGMEQKERFPGACFAHWHGDEMALLSLGGRIGVTILVSHSRDGETMARAARSLGYRVARGSSSRGAVGGLLALIKAARAGEHVVLAVDGPRGPRGVCKPGIVRLAQKAGVPLLPAGVAVSRRVLFRKSWSQVYLPLPFARQVILIGDPIRFPEAVAAEDIDRHCRRVEEALGRTRERAEEALAGWRGC